jgi:hypothetical protein
VCRMLSHVVARCRMSSHVVACRRMSSHVVACRRMSSHVVACRRMLCAEVDRPSHSEALWCCVRCASSDPPCGTKMTSCRTGPAHDACAAATACGAPGAVVGSSFATGFFHRTTCAPNTSSALQPNAPMGITAHNARQRSPIVCQAGAGACVRFHAAVRRRASVRGVPDVVHLLEVAALV